MTLTEIPISKRSIPSRSQGSTASDGLGRMPMTKAQTKTELKTLERNLVTRNGAPIVVPAGVKVG
jgi:hypothetical protein